MGPYLLVGLGGFLGSISRFGLAQALTPLAPGDFPLATFTVNFLGSLTIGYLFEHYGSHPSFPLLGLFLGTGFLGGFTTFSTFSLEAVTLLKRGQLAVAGFYVVTSLLMCVGGVFLGQKLGRV